MSMALPQERPHTRALGSPEIRRMLTEFVRKRVAQSDVEDIVQTVLMEALASETVPDDPTELRKWLTGVARHKVADLHRRGGRERPAELPDIETGPPPVEEHELVEWAEEQAKGTKDGEATLRWMAREGEGDKLEHIAAEEKVPAATVRQRVSRMRRWMKQRWIAELAAAAAVLTVAIVLIARWLDKPEPKIVEETPAPGPTTSPIEDGRRRAAELRQAAFGSCDSLGTGGASTARDDAKKCLEGLDDAKRLDPAGDTSQRVQDARKRAEDVLTRPTNEQQEPSSVPTSVPSSAPTSSPTSSLENRAPAPISTSSPVDSDATSKDGPRKPTQTQVQPTKPGPMPTPTATTPTSGRAPTRGTQKGSSFGSSMDQQGTE